MSQPAANEVPLDDNVLRAAVECHLRNTEEQQGGQVKPDPKMGQVAEGDAREIRPIDKRGASSPKCPYVPAELFRGSRGDTNYHILGTSGPLVATFHGLNGTRTTFQDLATVLARCGYRVLTFDLFGHGLSSCPRFDVHRAYNYSVEFFVEQIDELLAHLKLDGEPIVIVGFSMGCLIAAAWARAHPERASKIVLTSPAGMLERKPPAVELIKHCRCCVPCFPLCVCRCCFSERKFISRFSPEEQENGSAQILWNRLMWQLFEKKGAIPAFIGCVTRLPLWSARGFFEEISERNTPVLILWGELDAIAPVSIAPKMVDCFSNCHLTVFPMCSHLVLADMPRASIANIATFMQFPETARLEDFHYLLPFDAKGKYRSPRDRHPEDMELSSYLTLLKWKPSHWIRIPTEKSDKATDAVDRAHSTRNTMLGEATLKSSRRRPEEFLETEDRFPGPGDVGKGG